MTKKLDPQSIDQYADKINARLRDAGFDLISYSNLRYAYWHGWTVETAFLTESGDQTRARAARKERVRQAGGGLVRVAASGRWYWYIPGEGTRGLDYFDTEDAAAKDFLK